MLAAMTRKSTRPVPKKKLAPKKSARTRAPRRLLVPFDAKERSGLKAEVARRKTEDPTAKVTEELVVRQLVRNNFCTPSAESTQPKTRSNDPKVVQTKPTKDQYGKKMTVRVGTAVQVFRWVGPRTFMQGSPKGEAGRWDDEGPQREVELTRGYWLGETPVTQAFWKAVMGTNPSRFQGDDKPTEMVSWDDTKAFCSKLNALAPGLDVRLPTEAEWENACRAGTTKATWVGDLTLSSDGVRAPELDELAVYYGNSPDGTMPVRSKQPNPWGFSDMLGNVYEWCEDFFGLYEAGPVVDPTGPVRGSTRVIRGGCWYSLARSVRAASRNGDDARLRDDSLGFRLARGHQA